MQAVEAGDVESGFGHSSCSNSTNEKLRKFTVSSREEMWKEKGFSFVVETYLESIKKAQEFYKSVEVCLKVSNETLLIILYVIELYERDAKMEYDEQNKCLRMLGDMIRFKERGGDVFGKEYVRVTRLVYEKREGILEFIRILEELNRAETVVKSHCKDGHFDIIKNVYTGHLLLLNRSRNQKKQLEKKLIRIKRWRKASNLMFGIGFFTVPILTGFVMFVPVPSAIEVLVGAFSAMVGSFGKWCSFLWNKRESAAEFQKDGLETIQLSSYISIKNMENLRVLIEKMFLKIEHLLGLTEQMRSVEEQPERTTMEEIKEIVIESLDKVREANEHLSIYDKDIKYSSQLVSERLTSLPTGSTPKQRS